MNNFSNKAHEPESLYEPQRVKRGHNHIWAGLFVLAIGVVFLLRQMGVLFPFWLFTWPMLLIIIGVFIGLKHGFRRGGWIIPIFIGGLFLLDYTIPGLNFRHFIWPIVLIAGGIMLIVRPKRRHDWRKWQHRWEREHNRYNDPEQRVSDNDFIDVTSVFGGVRKSIMSKNFKGGDVVNFMAGTEINLTQADINGPIVIEATNIFGGTKLIVPPTWNVHSEIVAIFGGVDDKRHINPDVMDPNKVVRLEGTCLFGGIEIKSF